MGDVYLEEKWGIGPAVLWQVGLGELDERCERQARPRDVPLKKRSEMKVGR